MSIWPQKYGHKNRRLMLFDFCTKWYWNSYIWERLNKEEKIILLLRSISCFNEAIQKAQIICRDLFRMIGINRALNLKISSLKTGKVAPNWWIKLMNNQKWCNEYYFYAMVQRDLYIEMLLWNFTTWTSNCGFVSVFMNVNWKSHFYCASEKKTHNSDKLLITCSLALFFHYKTKAPKIPKCVFTWNKRHQVPVHPFRMS